MQCIIGLCLLLDDASVACQQLSYFFVNSFESCRVQLITFKLHRATDMVKVLIATIMLTEFNNSNTFLLFYNTLSLSFL